MSLAWTPCGAAGAAPGSALGAAGAPPFPADVVAAAAEQDLGPELVHLAWELARLAGPLPHAEGRALLLLVLALLAAQRDGSTRLPIDAAGPLPALLAALGATGADREAVEALLAAADAGDVRLRLLFGRAEGGASAGRAGAGPAPTSGGEPTPSGVGAGPAPARADYKPLLRVGPYLYAERLWQLEHRVVARLRDLLGAPSGADAAAVEAALADLRGRPAHDAAGRPVPLSGEQEAALRAALAGRLAAITGGPGTGKTWIVAALLRVVARLGDPPLDAIALAAPTGKAADRLQASLRAALAGIADPAEADRRLLAEPPAAATLHRLLNYSPGGERFLRHERNPLAERLVLVDESSMLDLALAERLLRSLPQGGRVVLLGDAQQLPSVEAGSVFRDLVAAAAGSGRVARLTHSFRMDARDPAGSAILELAAAISTGRSPLSAIALREDAAAVAFTGAELLSSPPAPLASFLARWWQWRTTSLPGWEALVEREWHAEAGLIVAAELPDLATLFTHHESARLLSATRGWSGGTGAAALNAWFRAALVGALGERRRGARSDAQPIPGEPVLVTRNDYRRALYNGDQGVVLRVAAEGEPAAPMAVLRVPGGGFRALPLASLRGHLEPAWASTVHKAQGSEHDAVALVLPAVENRLLTRELLYTAVTRARHSVVVVGTADRLAAAAARAIERWSGIAEALAAETGAPATAAVPRQQLRLFPE